MCVRVEVEVCVGDTHAGEYIVCLAYGSLCQLLHCTNSLHENLVLINHEEVGDSFSITQRHVCVLQERTDKLITYSASS